MKRMHSLWAGNLYMEIQKWGSRTSSVVILHFSSAQDEAGQKRNIMLWPNVKGILPLWNTVSLMESRWSPGWKRGRTREDGAGRCRGEGRYMPGQMLWKSKEWNSLGNRFEKCNSRKQKKAKYREQKHSAEQGEERVAKELQGKNTTRRWLYGLKGTWGPKKTLQRIYQQRGQVKKTGAKIIENTKTWSCKTLMF